MDAFAVGVVFAWSLLMVFAVGYLVGEKWGRKP